MSNNRTSSCCGSKRSAFIQRQRDEEQISTYEPYSPSKPVFFKYYGKNALEIRGGITGRKYHFDPSNPIQEVDSRDAGSMTGIPELAKI